MLSAFSLSCRSTGSIAAALADGLGIRQDVLTMMTAYWGSRDGERISKGEENLRKSN